MSNTCSQIARLFAAHAELFADEPQPRELRRSRMEYLGFVPLQHVPDNCMAESVDADGHHDPGSLVNHSNLQITLRNGRRFESIYAMTVAEFIALHARLRPGILSVQSSSEAAGIDVRHSHPILTTAEQLLVWLEYVKATRMGGLMVMFPTVSESTLWRSIDHVTEAINYIWYGNIQWPDQSERAGLHEGFAIEARAVGVLDGTHCEIDMPAVNADAYRAGHKKRYTQNYLCVVNVFGLVIYVAGPFPGATGDRGAWKQCALFADRDSFFSPGEVLLADGGFVGGRYLMCPYHVDDIRRAASTEERDAMVQHNNELSQDRTLVEDAFAWIKQCAPVLGTRFHRYRTRQGEAVFAVCRWWNELRRLRGEYAFTQL